MVRIQSGLGELSFPLDGAGNGKGMLLLQILVRHGGRGPCGVGERAEEVDGGVPRTLTGMPAW